MGLNEAMETLRWVGAVIAAGFAVRIIYPALMGWKRRRDDEERY